MKTVIFMKKAVICLFLSVLTAGSLFAQKASEYVSSEIYESLKEKGVIRTYTYQPGNPKLKLVPSTNLNRDVESFWKESEEAPAFTVENLYLLSKKDLGSPDKTNIEYASKVIRSVSKMEGLKYYTSNKKYTTLYKNAYVIKGPNDRTRMPDPVEGNADGMVIYALQDDHTFGKANFEVKYQQTEDEVGTNFINVTPMYMGFIQAVEAKNLRINLVITDCGEEFLVYMAIRSRFPAIQLFESMMYDSFNSRLEAIYNWFIGQF